MVAWRRGLTKVIKTFRTTVQCLELYQCEISNILPDVWEVWVAFKLSQICKNEDPLCGCSLTAGVVSWHFSELIDSSCQTTGTPSYVDRCESWGAYVEKPKYLGDPIV